MIFFINMSNAKVQCWSQINATNLNTLLTLPYIEYSANNRGDGSFSWRILDPLHVTCKVLIQVSDLVPDKHQLNIKVKAYLFEANFSTLPFDSFSKSPLLSSTRLSHQPLPPDVRTSVSQSPNQPLTAQAHKHHPPCRNAKSYRNTIPPISIPLKSPDPAPPRMSVPK